MAVCAIAGSAQAFQLDAENPRLRMRWIDAIGESQQGRERPYSNPVALELDYARLGDAAHIPDVFAPTRYLPLADAPAARPPDCLMGNARRGCATEEAWTLRFNMEPTWFHVLNGWDFSVPFNYSMSLGGNPIAGNPDDGSAMYNIGARMVYHSRHRFTFAYTGHNARRAGLWGLRQYNAGMPLTGRDWLNFNYEFSY